MTAQSIFQSIATVSIALTITSCGLTERIGKGHCMKTTDGYQICIKSEEVTCNADTEFPQYVSCSAFGRISSMTGEESMHWTSAREDKFVDSNGDIYCKGGYGDARKKSFTCEAAKVHSKI